MSIFGNIFQHCFPHLSTTLEFTGLRASVTIYANSIDRQNSFSPRFGFLGGPIPSPHRFVRENGRTQGRGAGSVSRNG